MFGSQTTIIQSHSLTSVQYGKQLINMNDLPHKMSKIKLRTSCVVDLHILEYVTILFRLSDEATVHVHVIYGSRTIHIINHKHGPDDRRKEISYTDVRFVCQLHHFAPLVHRTQPVSSTEHF